MLNFNIGVALRSWSDLSSEDKQIPHHPIHVGDFWQVPPFDKAETVKQPQARFVMAKNQSQ